ncbi:MAG: hypothetical protein AB1815_05845 [Bacillota bacterium]
MRKLRFIFLVLIFALLATSPSLAQPSAEIPLELLKQGGLNDSTAGGASVAGPFIRVVNWVIGVLAAILLVYSLFWLVVHVKDLITGTALSALKTKFISLGVAIVILVISLTGGWYDIIMWLHRNVIQKVLGAFTGAGG